MGYAMYCARKLMLTSKINRINFRLVQLTQQQQLLADQAGRLQQQIGFIRSVSNSIIGIGQSTSQAIQMQALSEKMAAANRSGDTWDQARIQKELANISAFNSIGNLSGQATSLFSSIGEQATLAAINCQETQIDTEIKRLETQLKAAEKELEKVEQVEDKAIERSTPKYV